MDSVKLAFYHFEQNNSEEALEIIGQILSSGRENEKFQAAYLLVDFGFLENAKEIVESLLENNKENNAYKSLLADIYIELNKDEKAIKLLDDIYPGDEYYLSALIQLADLYQAQGLYEVAEQKLYEAKKIEPSEEIIDLALAELYFTVGKFNQSIPIYEDLATDQESLAGIVFSERLAEAYAALGNHEKAFLYYEKIESKNADLLFKFGLSAFFLERYGFAIQKWEQLIEMDPYYYVVYQYLGEAYFLENMLSEAEDIVHQGLRFDEHNEDLYFLAAKIAHKKNNINESIRFIELARNINPVRREYTLFYISLLRESRREENIVEFLLKLLDKDDYDPIFEWELAKSYYDMDKFVESLHHYDEIATYYSDDHTFLYEYGHILIEAGRMTEGKKILRSYLELVPTDENTMEFLSRLENDW